MGRCLGCWGAGDVPIATTQPSPFSSTWGQDLGLHHVWMSRREKKQAQLLCWGWLGFWCFMPQAKPLTATVAGEQHASCPAWQMDPFFFLHFIPGLSPGESTAHAGVVGLV